MTLQSDIHQLKADLSAQYAERDTEINLGILAVLTRQHFLQLGPPGTAKSMLARDIAGAVGGRYFWHLMNRHMTPDQLFGPPDLGAIRKEGRLYYVSDGMLQEAHIFFADEIFKCSSATLNDLLTVANERLFKNGDQTVRVPLISIFGASNEMPSSDSEELEAFWDRFLIRKFVLPIRDPSNFVKMLTMGARTQQPVLTLEALEHAAEAIDAVAVPVSFLEHMVNLRNSLSFEGIEVSDRRWRQALGLCKAVAWLDEREGVIETDMSILQHVLWNSPQEIKPALRVILATANPLEEKVVDSMDQIEAIEAQLREKLKTFKLDPTKEARDAMRRDAIEWFIKLEELGSELVELQRQCEAESRPTDTVKDALTRLEDTAVKVGADAMGLDNYNNVKKNLQRKIYG